MFVFLLKIQIKPVSSTAPIALFTFSRPAHTAQTLAALQSNLLAEQSDLIIFSDGPRHQQDQEKVKEVRTLLHQVKGFRTVQVIERETNYGLSRNIIDGVTQICREYGQVIVLEDDLVTSPYFLKYMNEALSYYANNSQVASIHGYVYPVQEQLPETFFLRGADCWGWATWHRAWNLFNPNGSELLKELYRQNLTQEFDFAGAYPYTKMLKGQIAGTNDSWAIRWYASAFLQNKLTLYPGRSLVHNIGNDASGTHCGSSQTFDVKVSEQPIKVGDIPVEESKIARQAFINFGRRNQSWHNPCHMAMKWLRQLII